MPDAQVHYELFIRRRVDSSWALEHAAEDRTRVLEMAGELLADGRAVAVRVSRETLDRDTGEYRSFTLMTQGAPEPVRQRRREVHDLAPLCVSPQDLYGAQGRERVGRLLDAWLRRQNATAFELLHRPDLAEKLEASGSDIQHAIQKVAVPEAQARGVGVHEVIRAYQSLADRAIVRLVQDGRAGVFPVPTPATFAETTVRLAGQAEAAYRLGGAVAAALAPLATWRDKVDLLLTFAEGAPAEGAPRRLALAVLEQPLAEIVGHRAGFSDLAGGERDLGAELLIFAQLAAPKEAQAVIALDPAAARLFPPLSGPAARLAERMAREPFEDLRTALGKRVLTELNGPRRLRPTDAEGEIAVLRVLAMALTASAGRLLSPEDVQSAFAHRSQMITSSDFVERFLDGCGTALAEAQALVRLTENVVGGACKRAAARWIAASVGALRFETELRRGPDSASHKLAALALLQRAVMAHDLPEAERDGVVGRIGEVAGLVEADAHLIHLIARAAAPAPHRLQLLLQLATGEAGPMGPVAERARAEAVKLLREPAARSELAAAPPAALDRVRRMMHAAGLAAA